jgi:hypothetical protein
MLHVDYRGEATVAVKADQPEPWIEITVTRDGKTYRGVYRVERGIVTVTTLNGRKSTQVGGSTAKSIARILLGELVSDGNAD